MLAIRMRVLPPTHVITEKLNSLNEHHCDFAALLPAVRAVREQVDWDRLRADTAKTTSQWRFWCSPTGWASPTDCRRVSIVTPGAIRWTLSSLVTLSAVGPQFISASIRRAASRRAVCSHHVEMPQWCIMTTEHKSRRLAQLVGPVVDGFRGAPPTAAAAITPARISGQARTSRPDRGTPQPFGDGLDRDGHFGWFEHLEVGADRREIEHHPFRVVRARGDDAGVGAVRLRSSPMMARSAVRQPASGAK